MRILRLMLAGLVALGAMLAVLFAAVVAVLMGLLGLLAGTFRREQSTRPAQGTPDGVEKFRRAPRDDVIEIEATRVPEEGADRRS